MDVYILPQVEKSIEAGDRWAVHPYTPLGRVLPGPVLDIPPGIRYTKFLD
jgi:hypothetical protein